VEAIDCSNFDDPVQLCRFEDEAEYSARQYNVADGTVPRSINLGARRGAARLIGTYDHLFDLDFPGYTPSHVNAAAMFQTNVRTADFAMAALDSRLCRFDRHSNYVCDSEDLNIERPNLGAILGTTYYYAKNLGDEGRGHIYYVEDIQTDYPTHVDSASLDISPDVYDGAVLDFAAVREMGVPIFDDKYNNGAHRSCA